jgi:hypothetical protein
MSAAVWNLKNENDANKKGFTSHSNHKILHSACFTHDNIFAAFMSVILCSLDGYQKLHAIRSFKPKQNFQLDEALCINSTSYDWGILKTMYQGPCANSIRKGP